ncbi:hypothetical protein CTheo_6125 [Ceratobasidium theobromae]|uniref:Transmembrane protein n=1 Tax=Ceratobasidium theobromae TaxID=1582974 RepID=A0A5N5QFX5_9AGAM|nr:hypothetical protein CTheo_6125 [Ceratobasidium theobromae]
MKYLRQELPSGVNSIPLAAYAFMSGYLNAISFTTAAIWCGFMTGNSVMLGLALARVSLGHRREAAFAINDAQATTALVCFAIGIALGRVGDWEWWADKADDKSDVESGFGSAAPTRVGTPVGKISPAIPSPCRTRLWLVVGTLFQALLLVGAAIASIHDATPWSSIAGFSALALMSVSMGMQGVMAHRMGSGFGATVVLSSLWVELVGSPGGFRWREYRGVRVYTILLFIAGGLVGAVLRDAGVLGVSNALFVGAGMRALIALSWIFVPMCNVLAIRAAELAAAMEFRQYSAAESLGSDNSWVLSFAHLSSDTVRLLALPRQGSSALTASKNQPSSHRGAQEKKSILISPSRASRIHSRRHRSWGIRRQATPNFTQMT